MLKKKTRRYRVIKFRLDAKLDPSTIEAWLNEATEEEYIHDVIKEGSHVMLISCERFRRPRRRSLVTKKNKPAKKTTKKTAATKKATK